MCAGSSTYVNERHLRHYTLLRNVCANAAKTG